MSPQSAPSPRTSPARATPPLIICSTVSRVACSILGLAAAVGCLDQGWHHGLHAALRLAGPMLLAIGSCWSLWGWPRLVLDADHLRVDNALRSIVVPWDDLTSLEVRWGLMLHAAGRTIHVSAAPLRSGLASAARRQSPEQRQLTVETARAADRRVTLALDAATACVVIEDRLENHRTSLANGLRGPTSATMHASWQWFHLTVLAVGLIGTLWVVLG